MRRLRLRFVLFALGLFAPIALLVERAINSVALERNLRHQVLAERVFDETERVLSQFLEPQERQPFDGYTQTSHAAAPGFVLGYFEIGPQGTIRTQPARSEAAQQGLLAAVEIARRHFGAEPRANADAGPAHLAQAPGTTVTVGKDADAGNEARAPVSAPAIDALRSLNKAAAERLDRFRSSDGNESMQKARGQGEPGPRQGEKQSAAQSAAGADELPPMLGQLVDAQTLLLYRTVIRTTQGYRQGVILSVAALCASLREQTVTAPELEGYAELQCGAAGELPAKRLGYAYEHRFADPFDALRARLLLQPLPGVGGAAYIYALCTLLVLIGSVGLLALYRMVAVTMRYAEQRSNFVAAVSHELKTPLTAIRMYGEMLRDGLVASDGKRHEYYRHITGEAERLSRLITNVLEFARLEKGAVQRAPTNGNINAVVDEVAVLLQPRLEAEGFTLVVTSTDGLPAVPFDRDGLIQVLANLVDNAAKYGRDAVDKRIELHTQVRDSRVRLAVRDHGPGVTPTQLKRIFEAFYRGENELTRRHKGTGIGLALVRSLCDAMQAQVEARNHPDGGLVVEISWDSAERAAPRRPAP